MLSFSTEFPIQSSDPDQFAACVRGWVSKMPLGKLDSDQLERIASGKITQVNSGNHTLERIEFTDDAGTSLAFRHSVKDAGVLYTTRIIFSVERGESWVGVRNERVADAPKIRLHESKKPQIIKALISTLGGGLDGELFVGDKPHFLRSNDANMAIRLLNGDSENHLPVVYVSCDRNGDILVDVSALARMCGGLAHVVVEPSREFSRSIQRETYSRNAYGGAIGVYMPTGERSLVIPNDEDEYRLRMDVSDRVRRSLLNRRPLPRCTWQEIISRQSRKNIEELKKAGSEDVDAFVKEFDAENRALRGRLDEAEGEIADLKAKLTAASLQSQSSSASAALSFGQDYFPNETKEFIRDALRAQLPMHHDGSRRQHKIEEVVENLGTSDQAGTRKEQVKRVLNSASKFDSNVADALKSLGFAIKSEKKHFKLIYNDDERYQFTLPKTPSDHRSFKNVASDIVKAVF